MEVIHDGERRERKRQREREREGEKGVSVSEREGAVVLAADWVRFVGPPKPPSQEINNTYIHA